MVVVVVKTVAALLESSVCPDREEYNDFQNDMCAAGLSRLDMRCPLLVILGHALEQTRKGCSADHKADRREAAAAVVVVEVVVASHMLGSSESRSDRNSLVGR